MAIPLIRIKRGFNIPYPKASTQIIDAEPPKFVALCLDDTDGLKPKLEIQEGDSINCGDTLITDKINNELRWIAPVSGSITQIVYGERKKCRAVIIKCNPIAPDKINDDLPIILNANENIENITPKRVRQILLKTGLWTELRKRPYDEIPNTDAPPTHLIVNLMDTNPGAPNPMDILHQRTKAFAAGIRALAKLVENNRLYLTIDKNERETFKKILDFCINNDGTTEIPNVFVRSFTGPHPAGLPGTQIHFLCPASEKRPIWHLDYQTALALGQTLLTRKFTPERFVGISGPNIDNPIIFKTVLGAKVSDLIQNFQTQGKRIIAGSLLNGRNTEELDFLGRFHRQISFLTEDSSRPFLGWLTPGFQKLSLLNLYPGRWLHKWFRTPIELSTLTHGEKRAVMPLGVFERVMPMDFLPTHLLRALLANDVEHAVNLGALELAEEDLGLCTFVCVGKNDYGKALRKILQQHKENTLKEDS